MVQSLTLPICTIKHEARRPQRAIKPISHVVNGMIISHAIHANRGMRSPLGWKRSQVVKGVLPDRPQKDDSHKDGVTNILVAVRPMETLPNPNNPLTMPTDDHDNELYDPSCLCWVNPDMCRSKWCLLNDHDDGAHDEEPPAPQPSIFTPIGLKAYFGAFLAIMVLSVMSPTNVRRVGLLGVRAGKGCSGMCCTVTVKFTRRRTVQTATLRHPGPVDEPNEYFSISRADPAFRAQGWPQGFLIPNRH